jgi:hypothetical protein
MTININNFVRDIVRMMLRRNHSFSSVEDLGAMSHVKAILSPFKLTLNRVKVKEYIIFAAKRILELISSETKGQLLSIMSDSCSRNNRNVFSVSIRYINDGVMRERTLGLLTQHGSQTGRSLADQTQELLTKINHPVAHIYSTCTDGGANMVKASQLIIDCQEVIRIYYGEFEFCLLIYPVPRFSLIHTPVLNL